MFGNLGFSSDCRLVGERLLYIYIYRCYVSFNFDFQATPQHEEEREPGKGRPQRPSRFEQEGERGPPAKKKKGEEETEEEGSSLSLSDRMKRRERPMTARERVGLLRVKWEEGGEKPKTGGGESREEEDFWFLPYTKLRELQGCPAYC